jgi:hypothetical protein
MREKESSVLILLASLIVNLTIMSGAWATRLDLKFTADVDKTCIFIGGLRKQEIRIPVHANEHGVTFEWDLQGSGTLSQPTTSMGQSEISYIPPDDIREGFEKVTITVTATTKSGNQIADSVNLILYVLPIKKRLAVLKQQWQIEEEKPNQKDAKRFQEFQQTLAQLTERYKQLTAQKQSDHNKIVSILVEIILELDLWHHFFTHSFLQEVEKASIDKNSQQTKREFERILFERLSMLLSLRAQLKLADQSFQKGCFTPPFEHNAFELYTEVLHEDPHNEHSRQRIYEIAKILKNRGNQAFLESDNRQAESYYQDYLQVAEYILYKLNDLSFKSEIIEVEKRIASFSMPTPTPTPHSTEPIIVSHSSHIERLTLSRPPQPHSLKELQESLPASLEEYKRLLGQEQTGQSVNRQLTDVIETIICDLRAIETILEEYYQDSQDADILTRLKRTRQTREQYEQEWIRRVR